MTRAARLATSTAIAVFAVLAILLARQIPSRHVKGDPGPGAFPTAVALVILLGASVIVIEDTRRPAEGAGYWRQAGVVATATAAYLLVLLFLGFVASTALFLIGVSRYLDEQRRVPPIARLLVGIGIPIVLWLVFSRLLDVVLPAGWLGL